MAQKDLRASLLVRCTAEEAAAIREAAKQERRTISSYVLHSVLGRIEHQRKFIDQWRKDNGGTVPPRLFLGQRCRTGDAGQLLF